ncbi:MAG: 23S rRNA (uracil(1939)-C(5))-methyltransferase RlmD [Patescibacteria group bacterium]
MRLKIEKLVFGGQGLARKDNKIFFIWNALPGEEIEADIIKNKKDFGEGLATKIIHAAKERIEARDKNFISTSPWQIIDYKTENKWKKEISLETLKKIGGQIFDNIEPEIIYPQEEYNYRNKMEFSFFEDDTNPGKFQLAFFNRGQKIKYPIENSELAEKCINETAHKILNWVNEQNLERRNLKTLIVRSDGNENTIASLFLKDKISFKKYPKLNKNFLGFQIYYSTHKSPASVPTELLYNDGQNYLITNLNNTQLKFGLLSFFQIHIPIFKLALEKISSEIDKNSEIIDYYSGVGAIGLTLADKVKKVFCVDNNQEAIGYAKENIKLNKLKNCEATCLPAEKITEIITKNKIIILDPPRAGLHPDIIEKLLQESPKKIIYLSCNISTQARDVKLLSEKYKIKNTTLYNFFPRTPHIESLIILEKK